jgi:hypothetical protein
VELQAKNDFQKNQKVLGSKGQCESESRVSLGSICNSKFSNSSILSSNV